MSLPERLKEAAELYTGPMQDLLNLARQKILDQEEEIKKLKWAATEHD